jgi:hypothetical protein
MTEWEEGYLQGWNDRREREKAILNAIENPQMSEVQLKILMQMRSEFTNDESRNEEEN